MGRRRAAILAALMVGGAVVAQPAHAEVDATGVLCGFTAVQDGTLTGQYMVGEVSAGPVVFGTRQGSVSCSIVVNGIDVTGPIEFSGLVVVAGAARLEYVADRGDDVRICTTLRAGPHESETTCEPATTIVLPDAHGRRGGHNGHAQTGGHKNKNPNAPTPTTPYHPRGTIEISSTVLGIVNYKFTNFDPPFATWACPPATGTSMTCTPPPPPAGKHNVCANVKVEAVSAVPGTAYGTSACAAPPGATTSNTGPSSTPSQANASPNSPFPWTCSAAPAQTVVWTVRCSVGP